MWGGGGGGGGVTTDLTSMNDHFATDILIHDFKSLMFIVTL